MDASARKAWAVLWGVLLLEYAFIFGWLQNYDNAFFHPEKSLTHSYLLEEGSAVRLADFRRGLNVQVVEWGAPRLSRPLSNLAEMLNAKFRAWLWQYLPPHPSLAFYWPLLFLLVPWLWYRVFRRLNFPPVAALAGVCLYVGSAGFLCPLLFTFHPSKSLVNLFSVLALYLAAGIHARWRQTATPPRRGCEAGAFAGLLAVVFTAFFCDETGLFVFVLPLAVLWPWLWRAARPRWVFWGAYLALLPLYFWAIKVGLPALHEALGYGRPDLTRYEALPPLRNLVWPDLGWWFQNFWCLLQDLARLTWNPFDRYPGAVLTALGLLYHAASLAFGAGIVVALRRTPWREGPQNPGWAGLLTSGVIFLALVHFQVFQFSAHPGTPTGIFYYGALFSLVWSALAASAAALLLRRWSWRPLAGALAFGMAIFAADGLVFTCYRHHYYMVATTTFGLRTNTAPLREERRYYSFRESWAQARTKWRYVSAVWNSVVRDAAPAGPPPPLETECRYLDPLKGMLTCELLGLRDGGRNFILQPAQLALADVDADGRADLLSYDTTIRDRGFVKVGRSDGARFAPFVPALAFWVEGDSRLDGSGKDAEKRMRYGDLNGDGRSDALYFETWRQFAVYVSLSTPRGFTERIPCLAFGPSHPEQLRVADADGDGRADVIYAEHAAGAPVWVHRSTGAGFAPPQSWSRRDRLDAAWIQYADVNGDGKADLLAADAAALEVHVALSTGERFGAPAPWPAPALAGAAAPDAVRWADVDGDGRADLVVYDRRGAARLLAACSNGAGFAAPRVWLSFAEAPPAQVYCADIDGDRRADAVWIDRHTFRARAARSDGTAFVRL